MKKNQVFAAVGLVLFAMLSRIICAHTGWYNFAPLAAIGFVSGMLIKDAKTAFVVAILGQFLADVYFQIFPTAVNIGFYGISQFFVYGGLIAATFIGHILHKANLKTIIGGTLGASIAFFLLSNLGYFAEGHNGYSAAGFVKTYVDAIPFFKTSLQADMVGSIVMFLVFFLVKMVVPSKLKAA